MRTMTTINWSCHKIKDSKGNLRATAHTGNRGGWVFTIETLKGQQPRLMGAHPDGRRISKACRSLRSAKLEAMGVLHPAEAMGWGRASGVILYRAQWDNLIFAVFATAADGMAFQWRDTENDVRSQPVQVSGIREARELASHVLWDLYPAETPAEAQQAADGPVEALIEALTVADVEFTPEQLAEMVDYLADRLR